MRHTNLNNTFFSKFIVPASDMHNKQIVTLYPQAAVQQSFNLETVRLVLSEFCREYSTLVQAGALNQPDNMLQFLQGYDYVGDICTNWPEHCDIGNRLVEIVAEVPYQRLITSFSDYVCAE